LRDEYPTRTEIAQDFRCIGAACEDTCCQGWSVPIDASAFEKYRNLPASPLRILIQENMVRTPQSADPAEAANPAVFAHIRMDAANQCPMLSADRLCRIQTEHGAEFLSHACATYPRIVHQAAGIQETALSLSCPEAARLVLLHLEAPAAPSPRTAAEAGAPIRSAESPAAWFWPIRESVLVLVLNRAYPLWQRMFLLGIFCRRLDSIAKGELPRTVPAFLEDFQATLAAGTLRPAMESLPFDRAAQLDVVLRLAGLLLHRSNVRPRFVECVQAFTAGIGNGPGATLESLTAQFSLAHDRYYAPFFAAQPHILENYLVNTIVRCRFPFGRKESEPGAAPSMARQFAILTAQFALMKGLLIGVAGCHRHLFSPAHVVHTVQAASKHFDHHPEFLNLAHSLLVESGMEGARGFAILLRNAAPKPASGGPRPASPAIPAPGPPA
jgi:lysine-N-methylase